MHLLFYNLRIVQSEESTRNIFLYCKEKCKLIAIDLSKQQELDADPRSIQLINFTGSLKRAGNIARLSIIKEVNETHSKKSILDFSQRTGKVL